MSSKADVLPPQRLEEILADFRDHAKFCRQSLTIPDKRGQVVTLNITPSQIKVTRAIEKQERRNKPVRVVVLKGRQVHMSVGIASHMFKRLAFFSGQRGMVVGDSYKSARNLWNYLDHFDRNYKAFEGIGKADTQRRIQPTQSSSGMLKWNNGSEIETATARNLAAGRSYSLRHVHISEYAFYGDASTLMGGLMQSVPNDAGTSVFVESTANGIGDPFYELWMQASSGKTGWAAVFFPWFEHPEYSMPVEGSVRDFQISLDREETALRQAHGLTLEQLNWRRWCIVNGCQGSIDVFHQEHPSTPDEAFLTSGRPVFDPAGITEIYRPEDPMVGELEEITLGVQKRIMFREQAGGCMELYRKPQPGRTYVIGGDPAQGIDVSADTGSSQNPDYSVAIVLDQETGEQVAKVRERLTGSLFGQYTAALGKFYNGAYVVPEAGAYGIPYIESIQREQYPMHLVHQRRRDPTDRRPPLLEEIGFKTTNVSRPQLIDLLSNSIRERSILLHSTNTVQELRTFITKADGRTEGQQKCHDDEVFALALAVIGLQFAPAVRRGMVSGEQKLEPQKYRRFGGGKYRDEDD